jgi:NifU-like protein involved in Fe-S cluster formation
MDYSPEVVRRFLTIAAEQETGETNVAVRFVESEAEDRTLNVWVRFRVGVSGGVVVSVEPEVFGCPHTIAAASWAADWLRGGPAERLGRLDIQSMRRALEVPTEKLGKLLRIEDALAGCWARLENSAGEGARKEG